MKIRRKKKPSSILREGARVYREEPWRWMRRAWRYVQEGKYCYCIEGIVARCAHGEDHHTPSTPLSRECLAYLMKALPVRYQNLGRVSMYNDSCRRTVDEIIELLEAGAALAERAGR